MNRSSIIGHLTSDPELRMTQSGNSVCTFKVAVQRRFTNQQGERQADFIPCVTWRGLAESCGKHLKKGSKVFVSGSLQNRSYEAQDGTKRYITEIIADECEFLDRKPQGQQDEPEQNGFGTEIEEDLPF